MIANLQNTVHEVRILKERDDFSGGVVQIPLLPSGIEIDLSRTSGGGNGKIKVTEKMLGEIAANFKEWPMPVGISFPPHTDDRNGPQPAFVDSVEVSDGTLWGTIDAGSFLFDMLVRERAFRGASVELRLDPKTATANLNGWVLTGGILTNQPATPTLFKVAAEDGDDPDACTLRGMAAFQLRPTGHKEHDMSKDAAALEAKISEQETALSERDQKIVDLQAKLDAAEQTKTEQTEKISDLQGSVQTITAELATLRSDALLDKVTAAIKAAKEKGVPPVFFNGSDEDPVKWMETNFANFEGFQRMLDAFPAAKSATIRSDNGAGPGDGGPDLLETEARKLVVEGKAKNFSEAMDLIRQTNPDLYAAGTASLKLERQKQS